MNSMYSYSTLLKEADWNPGFVGEEGVAEARTQDPVHLTRNLLTGLGVGGLAGTAAYFLMRDTKDEPDKKKRRKRAMRTILASLGIGAGVGLVTAGAMTAGDMLRGTNFTHKYRIPDKNTDGEHPDIQIHFVGGGGGAQTEDVTKGLVNLDRLATNYWYGPGNTYLINANDGYYAEDLVKKIHEQVPGARIHISGHSHGGTSAYRLAKWCAKNGIEVDQLDTIDPISRLTRMSGKPDTTKRWNNYRLSDYKLDNEGNMWAWLGGIKGKLKGSEDHVFSPDSVYGTHTNMRYVPLDDGTEPYDTTIPMTEELATAIDYVNAALQANNNNNNNKGSSK